MAARLEAHMFIGGTELSDGTGERIIHVNPATGQEQGSVPVAGPDEVDRAVRAARTAFPAWRSVGATQRREMLTAIADGLLADVSELAGLAIRENGTPRMFAEQLGSRSAAGWFRYFAGWPDKLLGEVMPAMAANATQLDYVVPEPYGVIAVLTAFNAPMSFIGMKVAAALAAGNCVVIKPSELAPYTTGRFAEICRRVGIPDGVINVIHGDGRSGAALVAHPGIDKITFTGSGANARKIMTGAAANLTPVAFELGGKSAALVFADADIEASLRMIIQRGIGMQTGQACLAPTRVLAERSAYDRILEEASFSAQQLVIGDPNDATTQVGPVISAFHRDRILQVIADTDGRVITGGNAVGGALASGFYLEPTVVADVPPDSSIAQNEIFGPVLSVIPFDSEDEAVEIANGTEYGLAGYVFTRSIGRAHRVAGQLDAGTVSVNTVAFPAPHVPFGGNKRSGIGREGGLEGLREMLRTKHVAIDTAAD